MHVADLLPGRTTGRGLRRPLPARPEGTADAAPSLQADIDDAYRRFWDMMPVPLFSRMGSLWRADAPTRAADDTPRVDVEDTGDEIRVEAELPGFDESDIDVGIARDGLVLRAEHRADSETNRREFIIHERRFDRLERFVQLPPGINPDAATAALSNGVLTVIIPKTNEARTDTKPIPVQRG